MKNIQRIPIAIFTLLCLYSCVYSYEDGNNIRKTDAGMMVYNETALTLAEYIAVLDLARKIDKYLQAEGVERDQIKYDLLEGYDILEGDNNSVRVKNGCLDLVWVINRNSTSALTTASSQWSIECRSILSTREDGFLRLTAQSNINTWRMEVVDCVKEDSRSLGNGDFEIMANNKFDDISWDYEVKTMGNRSGTISSTLHEVFNTTYQITDPMLFTWIDSGFGYNSSYNYVWRVAKGEVEIEVERGSSDEVDDITAEISNDGNDILITFRGIREMWSSY